MPRTHKVTDVEQGIVAMTQAIQRNGKTRITFSGTEAYTNGETINLPAVGDSTTVTSEEAKIIEGYALHEGPGHVRHTNFPAWEKEVKAMEQAGKSQEHILKVKEMINGIEDWRIEASHVAEYPASAEAFNATSRAVNEDALKQMAEAKAMGIVPNWDSVGPLAVANEGRRRVVGGGDENLHDEFMAALPDDIRERAIEIMDEAQKKCPILTGQGTDEMGRPFKHSKPGFAKVIDLAKRLVEEDDEERAGPGGGGMGNPREGEEGDNGKGEAKGESKTPEGEGKGNQSGGSQKGDGEGQPEGDEQGDGQGNSGDGDDNSGDGDGQGDGKGRGQGEQGEGDDDQKAGSKAKTYDDGTRSGHVEIKSAGDVISKLLLTNNDTTTGAPWSRQFDMVWDKNTPTRFICKGNCKWMEGSWHHEYTHLNAPDGNERYTRIMSKIKGQTSVIQRELQRSLVSMTESRYDGGQFHGRLDPRRLVSAMTLTPNVYKLRQEEKDLDVAIAYLVDLSQSMSGSAIQLAVQSMIALCKSTDAVNIPSAVYGYTGMPAFGFVGTAEDAASRSKAKAEFAKVVDPINAAGKRYHDEGGPGRRAGSLIMVKAKTFEERLAQAKGRLGNMSLMAIGNTPTGEGIDWVIPQLMARKERRKVLVILTDGSPGVHEFGASSNETQHARDAIERCERMGIDTLAIGIQERSVAQWAPRYTVVHNVDTLAKTVMKEVGPLLMGTKTSDRSQLIKASAAAKRRAA